MKRWNHQFGRTRNTERGATATEYIILLALVAVAAVGVWNKFGKAIGERLGVQTAEITGLESTMPEAQNND